MFCCYSKHKLANNRAADPIPRTCITAHAMTFACKLVKQAIQGQSSLVVTCLQPVHKECVLADP